MHHEIRGYTAAMESFFSTTDGRTEHKKSLTGKGGTNYAKGYWDSLLNCLHMVHETGGI